MKFLIMHAATKCKQGEVRKVMLIAISKAHLYAPIEGEKYVDLAPERAKGGKCAELQYTLCGLRTAASSWEREYSHGGGGICSGDCLEVQILPPREDDQDRRSRGDFVIEGGQEDLDWTKGVLANKYLVKVRSILGPERQDDKVAGILNRLVEWHDDELWWEADPRHLGKMLEDIGLEVCKPGAVPGTRTGDRSVHRRQE